MTPSVTPDGEAELAAWLATNGIDTAQWGAAGTKRIADLGQEISRGESVLTTDPPTRNVTLVQVILRRGDEVLLELAQEMRDGQVRHRQQPPSEKLIAGEEALSAAGRCLLEEVGLTADQVTRLALSGPPHVSEVDSPSYPGLPTRYTVYRVEATADGLPDDDFWHDNHGAGDSDPVLRHQWGWRPIP